MYVGVETRGRGAVTAVQGMPPILLPTVHSVAILSPHSYTLLSLLPFSLTPQIKYVETSAKIQLNVEKAFHDLVRVIRQAQKPDNLKEKKKKKRRVCVVL